MNSGFYFLSCYSISVQDCFFTLHIAISNGHLSIVKYLVEAGVDPLITNKVSN